MEMGIYVIDGWGKGSAKGSVFKGFPLEPTSEEYKIVERVTSAFLKDWSIVGIWKNKYGSYIIQVKTENVDVNDCGNWDHYYAFIVVPPKGAVWVSNGLR
jgi:hypothetical protein